MARACRPAGGTGNRANQPREPPLRTLHDVLERQYPAQWTVSAYANELGITLPHLNAICKQLSGASALSLIHARVLRAARRALSYTDKSLADIAASLEFTEPSYFTRFFKREMHMTPKQYRRRMGTVSG